MSISFLAACGSDGGAASTATVRDSAGVAIVENAGTGATWSDRQPWLVREEPEVDIGTLEGEEPYQLFRVTGALRLSDGRIVVANGGSSELRYFDANGEFLMSAGRQGSGPGEFERLGWVRSMPGDSVFAYDSSTRRVSVFDAAGEFVRSFQVTSPGERQFPLAQGMFDDGKVLVMNLNLFGADGPPPDGYQRRSDTYQVFSSQGELESEIGSFLGAETFMRSGREGGNTFISIAQIPFGHSPSAVAAGEHLVYGSSDTYEYGVYARDGSLLRIVRRAFEPRGVTDADLAAFIDRQVEDREGQQTRAEVEKQYADMPLPNTMPAYDDIERDAEGNIWVRDFSPDVDAPRTWTVFDSVGQMRGSLTVPAGVSVLQIGTDYVIGRWRDDLDVEHVRVYGIVKGGEYS